MLINKMIPLTTVAKDYKDAYQFCNYDRGHIAPLATFLKK